MLTRAAFAFRIAVAVLLAAIGLQAIPAHALPMRLDHGSAFSASTSEVTLAARQSRIGEVRLAPTPLPTRPPVVVTPAAEIALADTAWPPAFATGPPLRPIPLVRGPAPRAPPHPS